MRTLLLSVGTAALLMLGNTAQASVFDFSYVDSGTGGTLVTASGTIVTTGLNDDGQGDSDILSITGVRNGVAITGLNTFGGGDNLLADLGNLGLDAPYVDPNGLSFATQDGNDYNLWATYSTDSTWAEYGTDGGAGVVDFTLTAVPEPASMFLVIAGLMGLAVTVRRNRQGGGR